MVHTQQPKNIIPNQNYCGIDLCIQNAKGEFEFCWQKHCLLYPKGQNDKCTKKTQKNVFLLDMETIFI
jgi:hypothetical protein